jgi:adenylate cyclase
MADDPQSIPLAQGLADHRFHVFRRVMRALPHGPRCKYCYAPFKGIGPVFRIAGFGPSRLNPTLCNSCFEKLPLGGEEMEVGVLFVDVRGFTGMAERMPPAELQERLHRFYRIAGDVLVAHDGLIDKLVGDEVMALFLPPISDHDAVEQMVEAGLELVRRVSTEVGLPLGAGADFGVAFVGNVGPSEEAKNFTALGDVVNTASRLQGAAEAGRLVLSERVWSRVAERYPDAERVELDLKNKSAPVAARILAAAVPDPA